MQPAAQDPTADAPSADAPTAGAPTTAPPAVDDPAAPVPAAQDPTVKATAPEGKPGDDPAADAATGDAPAAGTGAGEDLKARYREALAHKHGSSGVNRAGHGDKGTAAHPQDAHPGERMFRRKAGG